MNIKKFYELIFDTGCIKFGDFTLKSGIKSPIYVDFRVIVSNPASLKEIGEIMGIKAKELNPDRLGAIPYAGLPLGVSASMSANIPLIYSRKEVKSYGTGKLIEGNFDKNDNVLILDDIVTDGASKIEAILPFKEAGMNVKDILVIIDREQGGKKLLTDAGYTLHSLGTLTEIVDHLSDINKISNEIKDKVKDFINQNQFKEIKI